MTEASGKVENMFATLLETGRPRAGRRFEPTHEAALHADALRACESLPGANGGVIVVREMAGPIGIPDFTALVGSPARLQRRLELQVPFLLNQIDAAIIAVLYTRVGQPLDVVADRLGWPVPTIRRRISNLLDVGAVRRMSTGGLRRHTALQSVGHLYAVEAKVRDRGAAVQQARSYASWTDSYVLVMGGLGERPLARLRSDVAEDRGGLMVDGHWVIRPRLNSLPAPRRLLGSEFFVAAVAGGAYQPSVVA